MRERVADWRRALRPLRRGTLLGPMIEALQLRAVLRRIPDRPQLRVLAPHEFAHYLRSLTELCPDRQFPERIAFDYIIVRQEQLAQLDRAFLASLRAAYSCVYANARYLMFAASATPAADAATRAVIQRVDALVERVRPRTSVPARLIDRAVLVTTFARPAALRRSLPQLAALGCPLLVVDDGSTGAIAEANRDTCRACDATLLALPVNRGLAAALTIGISYLLADRRVEWISYFQDDVDVDGRIMETLRRIEDPVARPILTGYDADEHPAHADDRIDGVAVKVKRSSPAVHVHAHASYWMGVLPIPTQYLGAPRRRWEASLEDYWIFNHAPGSAERRGLPVICVPNLVRTFLWDAADSTWNNPNQPDPPLS